MARLTLTSTFKDPDNFPAVVLFQPFAGLIWLAGAGFFGKELESRPRRITYRGPLGISAARRVEPDAFALARRKLVGGGLVPAKIFDRICGPEVAGHALALFGIDDCRPMTTNDIELACTDFAPDAYPVEGRFVWVGGEISALEPFKVQGAQGFFRVSRTEATAAIKHRTTRKQREKARATVKVEHAISKCPCGTDFPKHLAEFMNDDPRSKHNCRCKRTYVVQGMKFVEAQRAQPGVQDGSR